MVEHPAVNRNVVGSSPTCGVPPRHKPVAGVFYARAQRSASPRRFAACGKGLRALANAALWPYVNPAERIGKLFGANSRTLYGRERDGLTALLQSAHNTFASFFELLFMWLTAALVVDGSFLPTLLNLTSSHSPHLTI